jgi:hypothetical protein
VPDAPATQVARYRDAVVDRREDLRGKYLRLGSGELTAAVLFAVLAFTAVTPQLTGQDEKAALWSALVPLIVVLVQAGAYWLLARSWVERAPMPPAVARLYRAFRTADPVMLAAGLVGILLWLPDRSSIVLLVVAVWAFGVVEYVNYFLVRLSYPISQWFTTVGQWRTPRLVADLDTSARKA